MNEPALDDLHLDTLLATHPEWEDLMCSPMLEGEKLTDVDLKNLQLSYGQSDWIVRSREMNVGVIREVWNDDQSLSHYIHCPLDVPTRHMMFDLCDKLNNRDLDFSPSMLIFENGRVQYWDDDINFEPELVCEAPAQYFYEIYELLISHPHDMIKTLIVALASRDKLSGQKKTLRKVV